MEGEPKGRKRKADWESHDRDSKRPKLEGRRKKYEKKVNAAKEKYRRGPKVKLNAIEDKKLRGQLTKKEATYREAIDKAARNELLLPETAGSLEAVGPLGKTWKIKQRDIKEAVDTQSASKIIDLTLPSGPYRVAYQRSGRHLLLTGRKGHIAMLDWQKNRLACELNVGESVRDGVFLHNETMFAVAQRQCVYVYDKKGTELHQMRKLTQPNRLDFLPYHFLLTSISQRGVLSYVDTSTGDSVAEFVTHLGPCDVMTHASATAIVHLGHHNGTVTLWSPNMNTPLVKILAHRGPLKAIAVSPSGQHMVSAGLDGRMKVWDMRTYRPLQEYVTKQPLDTLALSATGLLASGHGCHVEVWRNFTAEKSKEPYMTHTLPEGARVANLRFCPFEDVLALGHDGGFSSIIVPGSGEANFDTFEANPFATKTQRREATVHALLDKLPASTITLDPSIVGSVTRSDKERYLADQKLERGLKPKVKKERNKMRGKNKAAKKAARKQHNVVTEVRNNFESKRIQRIEEEKEKAQKEKNEIPTAPRDALARFGK